MATMKTVRTMQVRRWFVAGLVAATVAVTGLGGTAASAAPGEITTFPALSADAIYADQADREGSGLVIVPIAAAIVAVLPAPGIPVIAPLANSDQLPTQTETQTSSGDR